jgi:hypothetical protein
MINESVLVPQKCTGENLLKIKAYVDLHAIDPLQN